MGLENTIKKLLVGGAIIASSLSLAGCGGYERRVDASNNTVNSNARLDINQLNSDGPVLTGRYKAKKHKNGTWEIEGEGSPQSQSSSSNGGTTDGCKNTERISDEYTRDVEFVVEKGAKDSLYKVVELFKIATYQGNMPNDDIKVRSDIAGQLLPYLESSMTDPFYNKSGSVLNRCGGRIVLSREVLDGVVLRYQANTPSATENAPTSEASNEEPAPEAPPAQYSAPQSRGHGGFHGGAHFRMVQGDWLGRRFTPGGDVRSYHQRASGAYYRRR